MQMQVGPASLIIRRWLVSLVAERRRLAGWLAGRSSVTLEIRGLFIGLLAVLNCCLSIAGSSMSGWPLAYRL